MGMYKCVSDHTEDLTGGRTLAPGDYAEVDENDEHNAGRIEAGALIPVPDNVPIPKEPEEEGPAEATTEPGATDESTQTPPDATTETDNPQDTGKNRLSVAPSPPEPQGEAAIVENDKSKES